VIINESGLLQISAGNIVINGFLIISQSASLIINSTVSLIVNNLDIKNESQLILTPGDSPINVKLSAVIEGGILILTRLPTNNITIITWQYFTGRGFDKIALLYPNTNPNGISICSQISPTSYIISPSAISCSEEDEMLGEYRESYSEYYYLLLLLVLVVIFIVVAVKRKKIFEIIDRLQNEIC